MTQSLVERIRGAVPDIRGSLTENADLSKITWFRVGGPAEALFMPADDADLADVLAALGDDVPVMVLGLGSNLLVRDGGITGLVIRLSGKGFGQVEVTGDHTIQVGAAVPDVRLAKAAGEAGIAGFSFYRGIPGCVGGALSMNAGAHGGETKDILMEAHAVDRQGNRHVLSNADLGYAYRHCSAPKDYIFTKAIYRGTAGDPAELLTEMDEVARYREEVQPVKERTGGSTFKNPPGHSAWRVIDEAGFRGHRVGGAQMSEKHCNFMINVDGATGHDLETLGETVRAGVKAHSGIELEWEIKRLGTFRPGESVIPLMGQS
ncbi:UDP-N-acetylmuramate dehydrogenase [Pararhizobium sp. IMCC21322]|uniref:UDP-N-acetylmuramate dehydrogenase n=1 Tax=Pararhizobium sp. IMCC21322 TaxID=3067903 RepID=UPI002740D544|nr:UDP-N-acetylmuramate dehydrogenase [Pararhizobium sp. IMCC21322]